MAEGPGAGGHSASTEMAKMRARIEKLEADLDGGSMSNEERILVQKELVLLREKELFLLRQAAAVQPPAVPPAETNVWVVWPMEDVSGDEEQEPIVRTVSFVSDQDLQGFLASNEFAGLQRLPDRGYDPEDEKLLRRVRDLRAGERYLAMPSRGGIKALSSSVQGLKANTRHLASKSEKEMEAAIIEFGPKLMGWPSGVAVARPDLRQLTPPGESKSCEFDAVVEVTWQTDKAYLLGELKTSTKDIGDVFTLVEKADRVANSLPFKGNRVQSAFMAEFMSESVEQRVNQYCHKYGVIRFKRSTGGIVPVAVASRRFTAPPRPVLKTRLPTMSGGLMFRV